MDDQAYSNYDINIEKGSIVIMRPDGWIGYMLYFDKFLSINSYFNGFLKTKN